MRVDVALLARAVRCVLVISSSCSRWAVPSELEEPPKANGGEGAGDEGAPACIGVPALLARVGMLPIRCPGAPGRNAAALAPSLLITQRTASVTDARAIASVGRDRRL